MANTSNIHVLDNFSHDIVFNNQTRQWFVAFRYTDQGISATTVYVFRVLDNYKANFVSTSNRGSL